MEEYKISKNTDPKKGPLDGIQLMTDCVRTEFTHVPYKKKRTRFPFTQAMTKASISASVETGTFSIRDMNTDVMFAIRIDEAIAVCVAAIDASKALNENKHPEQDDSQASNLTNKEENEN